MSQERIPIWLRWIVSAALPILASLAFMGCMGNGIVAGALIGLAGREADVAVAQRNAIFWFTVSAVLQVAFALWVFSMLRIGEEATPILRYISRAAVAVLLSFPITLIVGEVIFYAIRLVWPHHSVR